MTRSVAAILAAAGASLAAGSPADDVARLARASNAFAFDLYKEVRKRPGNQIVAPASLSTALTMAWAGARGTTADEMKRVLHLDLAPAAATKASGTLTAALTDPQRPVVLRIANRLFGEKTYRFEPAYIEATRAAFGASLEPMDFRVASEASRGSINGWVEAQTEKRIANLIPPGGVDPQTRLVLVNAVYFLGGWDEAFPPKATGTEPFHTSKTAVKDVPTMHRSGTIACFQSESAGLQAIELPYKGRGLSMVIVLPDAVDGIAAVETRLTAAVFDTIVANLHNGQVSLSLPRFEVAPAASLSLASTLAALGMPAAFDRDKADFTGIANPAAPRDRLYVGAAFHKAFVKADEKGTEAAAASALSMAVRGEAPRVVTFKADHPFLFLIRDTATGLILFMGRVTDPGAP